jgi:hypothetical protein
VPLDFTRKVYSRKSGRAIEQIQMNPDFRIAILGRIGYVSTMTEMQQKRLKRIMRDALRIQDRFAAEPVLARTGRGYLKSEGVETLQRIKAGLRKSSAH